MGFNERVILRQMQTSAIEQYLLIRKIIGRLPLKDESHVRDLVAMLVAGSCKDREATLNALHEMLFVLEAGADAGGR